MQGSSWIPPYPSPGLFSRDLLFPPGSRLFLAPADRQSWAKVSPFCPFPGSVTCPSSAVCAGIQSVFYCGGCGLSASIRGLILPRASPPTHLPNPPGAFLGPRVSPALPRCAATASRPSVLLWRADAAPAKRICSNRPLDLSFARRRVARLRPPRLRRGQLAAYGVRRWKLR